MFTFLTARKVNLFYIDTNFIYGEIKIMAKSGIEALKNNQKLQLIKESGIILVLSDLNEYEIRRRLMQDFGKTFIEAKTAYLEFTNLLPSTQIQIKDLRITPVVINKMLQHKLGFRDGLHLLIAEKSRLPLVTSERKAGEWKKAYSQVYTLEEFWKQIRNGQPL